MYLGKKKLQLLCSASLYHNEYEGNWRIGSYFGGVRYNDLVNRQNRFGNFFTV